MNTIFLLRSISPTASEIEFGQLNDLEMQFRQSAIPGWQVVESAANADLILLLEANAFKGIRYLDRLRSCSIFRAHVAKCYSIDYHDGPEGFTAGAYTSLSSSRFDPTRHVAIGYPNNSLNQACERTLQERQQEPRYLFSFRGTVSHPVRRKILDNPSIQKHGRVTEIRDRWFNHSRDEQFDYANEVLESKFVLCPRGAGTTSVRLFEVMQLGRVPVIISDGWVPPKGIPWDDLSIRIAENAVESIPTTLASLEYKCRQMGVIARQFWEEWYSPENKTLRILESIKTLHCQRTDQDVESRNVDKWDSFGFRWSFGLTLPQRLTRKVLRRLGLRRHWFT